MWQLCVIAVQTFSAWWPWLTIMWPRWLCLTSYLAQCLQNHSYTHTCWCKSIVDTILNVEHKLQLCKTLLWNQPNVLKQIKHNVVPLKTKLATLSWYAHLIVKYGPFRSRRWLPRYSITARRVWSETYIRRWRWDSWNPIDMKYMIRTLALGILMRLVNNEYYW